MCYLDLGYSVRQRGGPHTAFFTAGHHAYALPRQLHPARNNVLCDGGSSALFAVEE